MYKKYSSSKKYEKSSPSPFLSRESSVCLYSPIDILRKNFKVAKNAIAALKHL